MSGRVIPGSKDQKPVWKYEPVGKGFHITEGNRHFITTSEDDAQWLVNMLGSDGFVKIYCKTEGCKGYGQYLVRTIEDLKKNIYTCESGCRQRMSK